MWAWSTKAGVLLAAVAVAPGLIAGCSCGDTSGSGAGGVGPGSGGSGGRGGTGAGFGGDIGAGGGRGGAPPCIGLECQQVVCSDGVKTTVSGTVFDPAGRVPLYNVIVYVPNEPLAPIVDGASCDQCSTTLSGSPIVTVLTDTQGHFVLEDVPAGDNIPLVIQVGKWRREFVLPKVDACVDTPTDAGTIRLPRNQSEGHIPKIALTTGGADPLECLLRKLGIDESEFTPETGTGRVNLFAGGTSDGFEVTTRYRDGYNEGAAFTPATSLWGTVESLRKYDMVLLACESAQLPDSKPASALQAMVDYASLGGRIFASHWHNYWLEYGGGQFARTAVWDHREDPAPEITALIDSTFPKGQALSDWLVNVQASTTPGEIRIVDPQHSVSAVNPNISTRWIYYEEPAPEGVQYFTFNTPIDRAEDERCGRVVYTDIHVSAGDITGPPFPDGCNDDELSPQEKALLFMLFDLSACITPDDEEPVVPVPR